MERANERKDAQIRAFERLSATQLSSRINFQPLYDGGRDFDLHGESKSAHVIDVSHLNPPTALRCLNLLGFAVVLNDDVVTFGYPYRFHCSYCGCWHQRQ